MVEIYIRNKKTYNGEGEYIGRPTVLSNPFIITKNQHRHTTIDRYAIWLKDAIKHNAPEVLTELERLFSILKDKQKLNLICWCSPKLCHGDIIKQVLINKYHYGSWLVDFNIGVRGL